MPPADSAAGLRGAARSLVVTRRGIGFLLGAALCFVLAPVLSLPALVYASGLLLALVAFSSVFVLVGHSRMRVERSFAPQVVSAGALSRATVRVTNLSSLPCVEGRWSERLPHGVSGDAAGTLPALGGRRSAESRISFSYALQSSRRGRHAIGPLLVDVCDPFGLVLRRHRFGDVEGLTVLPRRVALPPISPRGTGADGATRPVPQHAGLGDDDIIARVYAPGDALKRLHWKATAHRGELMVRQEEQRLTPRASVLLDTEPSSQSTARDSAGEWEHSAAFEWCDSAVASITTHLVAAGYVVDLQSSGGAVARHIADGQDTLEDAMVDLALLQPEPDGPDRRLTVEGAVFVVLGHPSVERAHDWVAALSGSRTVLALVDRSTRRTALDVLDGARWTIVRHEPRDDVAELWTFFDSGHAHAAG
ncbi:MAG: hypothetical protein JWP31_640 [Aeromicrobium sp.]|nr:hypothetical protein [Aeromicrobium sp.]